MTVVVLTFNEQKNIEACLASVVSWASAVVLVDSGSTDDTLAIAARYGVSVVTHSFETHARQWAWALATVPIDTEWVLGLDADQRATPELGAEIARITTSGEPGGPSGYFLPRRQVFRGRWIRHGGYYPKFLLKLFKKSAVHVDVNDLVDHHFTVDGTTKNLAFDLIEDNLNEASIAGWTAKHNRYAVLQAQHELAQSGATVPLSALRGSPDDRTQWMKRTWRRMPLFVRPTLYFVYRYIVRLGFLDGKEGFIFHVLQAFWYRLLVDINIDELRASTPAPVVDIESRPAAKVARPEAPPAR